MSNEIVASNVGCQRILGYYLGVGVPHGSLEYHLFASNVAIDPTVLTSVFTAAEADFAGYAASGVGTWTEAGLLSSRWTDVNDVITWLSTGAGGGNNQIYGYYVTDQADGEWVFAQHFHDGPYDMSLNGQALSVLPTLTMRPEFAAST